MIIKLDGITIIKGNRLQNNISPENQKHILNLTDQILSFSAIFSKKQRDKMMNFLNNNIEINLQTKYNGPHSTALSDVSIIEHDDSVGWKKTINLSIESSNFIKKHELWHALALPSEVTEYSTLPERGTYISGHGCIMYVKESFKRYKETGNLKNVLECGSPLEEGMANVISVLSTIKEKAQAEKNPKKKTNILKEADRYMETGEIGSALKGVFRGYYIPLEDITRLFILASKNDYLRNHSFSEVLESEEGIDGIIEKPVNKPYCSMISSALNGDFKFQGEFDKYIKIYNDKNEEQLMYYDDICGWINREQMEGIVNENKVSNLNKWNQIIETIEYYYGMKLRDVQNEFKGTDYMTEEKAEKLYSKFKRSCNIVRQNFHSRISPIEDNKHKISTQTIGNRIIHAKTPDKAIVSETFGEWKKRMIEKRIFKE